MQSHHQKRPAVQSLCQVGRLPRAVRGAWGEAVRLAAATDAQPAPAGALYPLHVPGLCVATPAGRWAVPVARGTHLAAYHTGRDTGTWATAARPAVVEMTQQNGMPA